jgi:hypothetical protein
MANEIQRVNYFPYQFLTAEDFTAERDYHIRMRELQNKHTYSPGVLDGLAVRHLDGRNVSIQPGMALNAEGRAIIVLEETPYVVPQDHTAIYLELRTRDIQDKDGRVFRKAEYPEILSGPSAPAGAIQLATIRWDARGNITGCDDSTRRQAGPKGIRQLDGPLRIGPPDMQLPTKLSASEIKLYVGGDLGINGNLALTGDVFGRTGTGFDTYGTPSGSDVAENYVSEMDLEPGDVVSLHPEKDQIVPSQVPNDPLVIGVISTAPALTLGSPRGRVFPVALCGRVPCKVVVENGPIRRGDLLTASSTPGHAMKAQPKLWQDYPVFCPGTIMGKALGALSNSHGLIDVLVWLR